MMRKWMAAMTLMLCLTTALCAAGADGYSQMYNGQVSYARYTGWYNEYTSAEGLGWSALGEKVYVISRNASFWSEPRTNSKRLDRVLHGTALDVYIGAYGAPEEQNGFYRVRYKNMDGWINKAYTAYRPLEIVLMEGNVPAYCAPTTRAKRVGSLDKLTRCKVLGFVDDYYVVSLREACAYIPMNVAHYDSAFEAAHTMRATGRTTDKVTLRCGPSERYASAGEKRAGTEFLVFDRIDGWYMLYDEDRGCFVYAPGDSVELTSGWATTY